MNRSLFSIYNTNTQQKRKHMTKLNKTKKTDVFMVDPRCITVDTGFNVREDYGDITELMLSILKDGVRQPLRGRRTKDGFVLTDGHRRFKAVQKALEEGNDIPLVPIFPEKRGYSEEQRVSDMVTLNSGKPLTAIEEAKVYERLIKDHGWKQKDIAQKFGKTQPHVSNLLKLLDMGDYLRDCLQGDLIKASLAIQVVKNHPDEKKQEQVVKSAIEKMNLLGKKRISEGHVTPEKKRSRHHKLLTESIEYMEQKKFAKAKIEKVQLIMEALDSKTPEDLVELISEIL